MIELMTVEDLKEYRNEKCPTWAIEDYLQFHDVFTHNSHAAHMDSYMTLIEYDRLKECLERIKDVFSQEQWKLVIEDWKFHNYHSPNAGQLALFAPSIVLKGGTK
jgi:hypothetical protein